jgi:hypothetical protein
MASDQIATQLVLTGFNQTAGIRIYAFEAVGKRGRLVCTVEVDLALIARYGIRIQDLPLLCTELVHKQPEPGLISTLTFTELDMRGQAEKRAIAREEAERKKPTRHAPSTNVGASWRSPSR